MLIFKKGGSTEKVLFLLANNDGYKLDTKHNTPIEANDLPALATAYAKRNLNWHTWQKRNIEENWTHNWWFAETDEIRAKEFDLSAGKYRPIKVSKIEHRDPLVLINELRTIEMKILKEVNALSKKISGISK